MAVGYRDRVQSIRVERIHGNAASNDTAPNNAAANNNTFEQLSSSNNAASNNTTSNKPPQTTPYVRGRNQVNFVGTPHLLALSPHSLRVFRSSFD